jgi:hypothetical protein
MLAPIMSMSHNNGGGAGPLVELQVVPMMVWHQIAVEVGAVGCWGSHQKVGLDGALSIISSQIDLASAGELQVEE